MSSINTWPGWRCVRQIGSGAFGKVYEIETTVKGKVKKAALKVMSVPANPEDVQEIYDSGLASSAADATTYINSQINSFAQEIRVMAALRGTPNIVTFEEHMIVPHQGWIGADILIRMELLTPLNQYMRSHPLTEADTVRLGIDICKALEVCHAKVPPILHRDIKSANIMVDSAGHFKLGDFGIARVLEGAKSAHTRAGTEDYMAPEVLQMKGYGTTADLYSLGMVLYKMLNNNRNPFLPVNGSLTADLQQQAKARRLSGETVPAPAYGSPFVKAVVLRSLAYIPEQRYQTAKDMRLALESCLKQLMKHYGGAGKGATPLQKLFGGADQSGSAQQNRSTGSGQSGSAQQNRSTGSGQGGSAQQNRSMGAGQGAAAQSRQYAGSGQGAAAQSRQYAGSGQGASAQPRQYAGAGQGAAAQPRQYAGSGQGAAAQPRQYEGSGQGAAAQQNMYAGAGKNRNAPAGGQNYSRPADKTQGKNKKPIGLIIGLVAAVVVLLFAIISLAGGGSSSSGGSSYSSDGYNTDTDNTDSGTQTDLTDVSSEAVSTDELEIYTDSMAILVGDTMRLRLNTGDWVMDGISESITWTSSDPEICSVSNGTLYAKSPGVFTIKALYEGKYTEGVMVVVEPDYSYGAQMSTNPAAVTLAQGGKADITLQLKGNLPDYYTVAVYDSAGLFIGFDWGDFTENDSCLLTLTDCFSEESMGQVTILLYESDEWNQGVYNHPLAAVSVPVSIQ